MTTVAHECTFSVGIDYVVSYAERQKPHMLEVICDCNVACNHRELQAAELDADAKPINVELASASTSASYYMHNEQIMPGASTVTNTYRSL